MEGTAKGVVASYDKDTKVLKYIQDRGSYLNPTSFDNTDFANVNTRSKVLLLKVQIHLVTYLVKVIQFLFHLVLKILLELQPQLVIDR